MTLLGKLFVIFNVSASLLLAFTAFGLYVNSVDFGYDTNKPGEVGGLINEAKDQIAQVQAAQAAAENTWKDARSKLWAAEEDRREDRAFYTSELDHLRNKANEDDPARVVEMVKSQPVRVMHPKLKRMLPKMVVAKVRGPKEMEDALPVLASRSAYDEKYEKDHKENLRLLADLRKEVAKDAIETDKMLDVSKIDEIQKIGRDIKGLEPGDLDEANKLVEARRAGTVPMGMGADTEPRGLRGLRTLLVDERAKREGLEVELGMLRPLYVNTSIEAALSNQRLVQLKERIEELKAYIKKRNLADEMVKR